MQTLTLQAWPSVEQDTAPSSLAGKLCRTHTLPLWRNMLIFLLFLNLFWMPTNVSEGKVIVVTWTEASVRSRAQQLALVPLSSVNHCLTQPESNEPQHWAMASPCCSDGSSPTAFSRGRISSAKSPEELLSMRAVWAWLNRALMIFRGHDRELI